MLNKLEFKVLRVQKIFQIWTKHDSNSTLTLKKNQFGEGQMDMDKTNGSALLHVKPFAVFKETCQRIGAKENTTVKWLLSSEKMLGAIRV